MNDSIRCELCGTTPLAVCLGPAFQIPLALAVGLVAWHVSWRGVKNNIIETRLDLFEKRFAVYKDAWDAAEIAWYSTDDEGASARIYERIDRAIHVARFLFEDDRVVNELTAIRPGLSKTAHLHKKQRQLWEAHSTGSTGSPIHNPELMEREDKIRNELEPVENQVTQSVEGLPNLFAGHMKVPKGY